MKARNLMIAVFALLLAGAVTWGFVCEANAKSEWETLCQNSPCVELTDEGAWLSSPASFPEDFYAYMQKDGWTLLPGEQEGAAVCFEKDGVRLRAYSDVHRHYVIWRRM